MYHLVDKVVLPSINKRNDESDTELDGFDQYENENGLSPDIK